MDITFLGANDTVTGSCYLVKTIESTFLVDCGMFQGTRELEERNYEPFLFDPKAVDFMLLTHAHIDHSGLIPKLINQGYRSPIYSTPATRDLCEVMLLDSAHIQEEEFEWKNRRRMRAGEPLLEPVYSIEDAGKCMEYFKTPPYNKSIQVAEDVSFCLRDAGHILGSSSIELTVIESGKSMKVVFSGDIGNAEQAIVKNPTPSDTADYVLIETTYASRQHKSRSDTLLEFKAILKECFASEGNIVIPAFAVERTQELVYVLGQMYRAGELPDIPVFIDSPLAISSTDIFRKHPECYNQETWDIVQSGESPLDLPTLKYTRTAEESRSINAVHKAIIISASGMCHAGRIKHHLKHNLWRPESHIIFVGYQAEGTTGKKIIDGATSVRLFNEDIAVKAHIHTLGGFSAHADQIGLSNWLNHIAPPPAKVFLTHGEGESMRFFSYFLTTENHYRVVIPQWKQTIHLRSPLLFTE
ncbi:hypothetical protein AUK40_03185 [Candidatus Wirthbacteria bacterium CG2_30_54_11]|uniref:MBL fold hydrolase n=1 Tax=Candidatus Wirthbacteria bacterium CG2_30_54_11 TaxID=1817892 RepID=A0A1J5IJZ6_9BACT|nr:MAG: hypothetical protein AUK40_03185 [Candidatus Wirthbacteria bacterium CG2_30_54_11]